MTDRDTTESSSFRLTDAVWNGGINLEIDYAVTPPGAEPGTISYRIRCQSASRGMEFSIKYGGNVYRRDHYGFSRSPDGRSYVRITSDDETHNLLELVRGLRVPVFITSNLLGGDVGGGSLAIRSVRMLWNTSWSGRLPDELDAIRPLIQAIEDLSSLPRVK